MAEQIATILPRRQWLALHEAIERATDPDQPLIGLAENLTALVRAADEALTESVQIGQKPGG